MVDETTMAIVKNMAMVTRLTGQIYEAQVDNIKKMGVLLFGHPVVIELNVEARTVTFIVQPNQNKDLSKSVPLARQAVEILLGPNWQVGVVTDDSAIHSASPGKRTTQRARKGSVRGVRKRRKATPKPKNK